MQANEVPATTSDIYYPSAAAVLIESDDTTTRPQLATAEYRNEYASAHLVGKGDSKVSLSSDRVIQATDTHATATTLDPWSKEPTVATANGFGDTTYQTPGPVDTTGVDTNEISIPPALYEDPLHKKMRRRRRRRGRMMIGGAGAFAIGSVLLGPFGAIGLTIAAAAIIKSSSKSFERKKDARVRRQLEELVEQHVSEEQQGRPIVIVRR